MRKIYKARTLVTEDSTKQGIGTSSRLSRSNSRTQRASKQTWPRVTVDLKLYRLVKGNGKECHNKIRGTDKSIGDVIFYEQAEQGL